MRIAFDCREALAKNPTGKGMWTKKVWEELKKHDIELTPFPMPDANSQKPMANSLVWHWKTSLKIRSLKPDIYLSPTSYIVPWLLGKSVPTAVVIHDLIAFDHEPHNRKAQLIERLTLPRVLKTAKWIFTVSEATKKDLVRRFPKADPEKMTVVHAGPALSTPSTSSTFPHIALAEVVDNECKQSSNHDERTCNVGQTEYIGEIHNNSSRKFSVQKARSTSKIPRTSASVNISGRDTLATAEAKKAIEALQNIAESTRRFGLVNRKRAAGNLNLIASNCITPKAGPYILSIGTLCPRKNQLRLIQAFNKLPDEIRKTHKLILAGGRGWDDEEIVKLAEESENVEWVGYVSDKELTELLKNAKLLAYPSLKEGFGFPVLDAMALGVPVLTSDKSSTREIANGAAALVDPESIDQISERLEDLVTNDDLRQSLSNKGIERSHTLSWQKTVDRMLKSLEN